MSGWILWLVKNETEWNTRNIEVPWELPEKRLGNNILWKSNDGNGWKSANSCGTGRLDVQSREIAWKTRLLPLIRDCLLALIFQIAQKLDQKSETWSLRLMLYLHFTIWCTDQSGQLQSFPRSWCGMRSIMMAWSRAFRLKNKVSTFAVVMSHSSLFNKRIESLGESLILISK
jgi:hypothetical protein